MPVTLAPTMVVPSLAVVAAATVVIAFWVPVGLVNPGMVNVIAWPCVNVAVVLLVGQGASRLIAAGFSNMPVSSNSRDLSALVRTPAATLMFLL